MKKAILFLTMTAVLAAPVYTYAQETADKDTAQEETAETTETTETTAETAETTAEGADTDWYMNVLDDAGLMKDYSCRAFVDINQDGVPLLFITTTPDSFIGFEDRGQLYAYADGDAKLLMKFGEMGGDVFYCDEEDHTLTWYSRLSGEEHISVYRLADGELELVTTIDRYDPHHSPDGDNAQPVCYRDAEEITEEEADALFTQYADEKNIVTYEEAPAADGEEEGETGLALDDGIGLYSGNWVEETAGRGYMEIEPSGDGKYYVTASWGNTAADKASWQFTAIYDAETGDLSYDEGSFREIHFDEDGSEEVTGEKSVQGTLHYEDGKILWTDNAYESDEPSVFVSEDDI